MGKASRRKKDAAGKTKVAPAPYTARPFAGLPGEADWVAAHEILPAATATLTLRADAVPEGSPQTVTLATVLPMAWPALRRDDGSVLIASQSGSTSGDPSRDLAQALLTALAAEPGAPVTQVPRASAQTPRLQDLLDTSADFDVTIHEGFDFWVDGQEVTGEAADSLERANESVVPTTPIESAPATYWCRIGERTYIRHVLADDEDAATTALARLHAKGEAHLGEDRRLLGAFRAGGLLVPVWEVPADTEAADHEDVIADFTSRYADALAATDELTPDERRARNGLLSRQVTLR
ncbi:DUF5926 family protein [Janibacter cremeus]|uniref:DUF5926 domain-containing protein n=1 Tax=Janibacter cremeus TaxID=1285192 RepID=A0A852VWN4_9MICO|nr:DUF5926 family protein [Janibacter cremeus]NYF98185.1 hypothetical protein [Janibacter cremeus]